MDIRYSCNQRDFKRYTTEETRSEFLIERLFVPNEVTAVYSHVDRMVTMGIMPAGETVPLDKGIDIYTISTLLGHKQVSSTQSYAKISSKKMMEAIVKIE